ncbi:MAG: alanine--tRNA ligase [Thermoleophilia bacterium]|nr:alanine--tRNA ligase [Thermoleophilia bacterium]
MKSAEIRRLFLDHFAVDNGHLVVPSASLVPSSYDPSVLLNVAGMQPFKPYFAGIDQPPNQRLASCQKCFRTPDIDEVGLTARHMTFFEMLGNFSFGDYFKQGAIEMAWDLIINKFEIPLDRLWVTIHEGDPKLGLELDTEARDFWLAVGVPADRIVALGEDNFWKAGPTGPCGPCSEIFYDRGPEWGPEGMPGDEGDRYLEFYNLVFMQYTRDEAGNLTELPAKNIDTGMGLERITSILQSNVSIFEIDSVQPIVQWAEKRSGRTYGSDQPTTKAMRVLVDHGRGMSFLASDGVTTSNEGRGYVLRRIIRRAIQHADRIGIYGADREGGVLAELHARVVDSFGDQYPQLVEHREAVAAIINAEEERFLRTLDKGLASFTQTIAALPVGAAFPGDEAFQLHDTYGFPVELTEELVGEAGRSLDKARFDTLMQEQRERARAASGGGSLPTEQAAKLVQSVAKTEFVGFDELSIETHVVAVEPVKGGDGSRVIIKLERSPFYAEGGGQVSDAGTITGPQGRATIEAVLKFETDQVVLADLDGTLAVGDPVVAAVDADERHATERNHTATHLLHAALQQVLGDHVAQKGSLVEPSRLRFDFSHPSAMTPDELAAVEAIIIDHVAAGEPVDWREVDIDAAREAGATMLFGEKYGDVVRMVSVGDGSWSRELCGGSHVTNTAQIRGVLVTHESSVGGGTRRIEALTGDGAARWLHERADAAVAAAQVLGVTEFDELPSKVDELKRSVARLERELSALRSGGALDDALAARVDAGPFVVVAHRDDSLTGDELLDLADRLKNKLGGGSVVLLGAALEDGKVALIVSVGDEAIAAGAHAGNLIKQVAGVVGGGGGGRPNMARAGGKDPRKLDEALAAGRAAVEQLAGAATGG